MPCWVLATGHPRLGCNGAARGLVPLKRLSAGIGLGLVASVFFGTRRVSTDASPTRRMLERRPRNLEPQCTKRRFVCRVTLEVCVAAKNIDARGKCECACPLCRFILGILQT